MDVLKAALILAVFLTIKPSLGKPTTCGCEDKGGCDEKCGFDPCECETIIVCPSSPSICDCTPCIIAPKSPCLSCGSCAMPAPSCPSSKSGAEGSSSACASASSNAGCGYSSSPKSEQDCETNVEYLSSSECVGGQSVHRDYGSFDASGQASSSSNDKMSAFYDTDKLEEMHGSIKHCYKTWDTLDVSKENTCQSTGTAMCKEMNYSKCVDFNDDVTYDSNCASLFDSKYDTNSAYCTEGTEWDQATFDQERYQSETEKKDRDIGSRNYDTNRGSNRNAGAGNKCSACYDRCC